MLLLSDDVLVCRQVHSFAASMGMCVATDEDRGEAGLIVVDVGRPGGTDAVASLRRRRPDAIIVGHVGLPDRARWEAAERAGCDVVANRGSLRRQLDRLAPNAAAGVVRRRRFALADSADVAGKLGLVCRAPDAPVGPVALYHVDGGLFAMDDTCPHAGASLCEGPIEGPIVTCPRHGSQFDVRTGERVRGPADQGVRRHPVADEGGRVYLLWV